MQITARRATTNDVADIIRICVDGWRDTTRGLRPETYIDRVIAEYYTPERVTRELDEAEGWDGWWVAVDEAGEVMGAGGGGMISTDEGELFVLYVDSVRRYRGAGTSLLAAITTQQMARGARAQWVSVVPGNAKGLPFYRARGFTFVEERPAHDNAEGDSFTALRLRRPL